MLEVQSNKSTEQSGHDWVRATNECQRERFILIREKQVCQQRSNRCGYLKSGKHSHDLACDRCAQRGKASFDRTNEPAHHIRDMMGNSLKRLLNSFIAQSVIELIKALIE